jgi:hypothetical protein
VIWSDKAFNIYMGQHGSVEAAELEPSRRRAVQDGILADTQRCVPAVEVDERTLRRIERRPAMDVMTMDVMTPAHGSAR